MRGNATTDTKDSRTKPSSGSALTLPAVHAHPKDAPPPPPPSSLECLPRVSAADRGTQRNASHPPSQPR
eukprot:2436544-Amphidinium_carterae.1